MSVAVLIDYVDPAAAAAAGAREYLPVATEGVYSKHWVPAAHALGCAWLPRFQEGVAVPLDEFLVVLKEFRRIRDYFERDPTSRLAERSKWLVEELERLDPSAIADLFIG
jgi:hypothetical protein